MSSPDFSVLMSVYHQESPARLEKALRSNLGEQTLCPTEFVLMCDGPLTEELESVIRGYQQQYPHIMNVCRLPQNVGLGRALNQGVLQCAYELIIRADSDDVSLPDRFEKQVAYMEQHPEVSAASGAVAEFESTPTEIQRVKRLPLHHEELKKYALKRNPLNHMATIFRKSHVLEVGSYQHVQYMEDYFLWVRLVAAGRKLGNMDDLLVHACVGNGMEARRSDKRTIESRRTIDTFLREHGMLSLWQHWLNMAIVRAWCATPAMVRNILYNNVLRSNKKKS